MSRTLTLRQGASYTIGQTVFRKGEPVPFPDERMLNRLIHTGLFEENPPLCYYYIRRKLKDADSQNRLAHIGDNWIRVSSDKLTKVTRYQWSQLSASNQFEIVPPLEVMDRFVADGKQNFSVLIIRDMGAGDVMIVTDVLYNLRLRYPQANIVLATSERYLCLVDGLDFLSSVQSIDSSNPEEFDLSVNLCGWSEQYPICAKVHRSDLFGTAFSPDFPWVERKISLALHSEEIKWFDYTNRELNPDGKPTIAIQPYGSSGHRSLRAKAVNEVIDWFCSNGYFVYVYGENQWQNLFPEIPGCSKTFWNEISIMQAFTIVAYAKLLICPDSSGYHAAAAFGTPSIPIFTTIHEGVRVTYYPKCYPIRATELNCSPCWDRPCGLADTMNCCGRITGERIIQKCKDVIEAGFPDNIHPIYAPPDWA